MHSLRRWILVGGVAALCAHATGGRAETTNAAPDFQEVYDLLRAHLVGRSEADLQRAAVFGLLDQFHHQVSLVGAAGAGAREAAATTTPVLGPARLHEGGLAYLRVGRVGPGLDQRLTEALKDLQTRAGTGTNRLRGVVLDLRYAGGRDYAAALAVADLFLDQAAPQLDWGGGLQSSTAKTNAITLPVTVLVNQETAAGAEAVAAILRTANRALILGSTTAGQATMDQVFPLKTGQSLRIATAGIKLANGTSLGAGGLDPDISVAVTVDDEKAFYEDPYREATRGGGLAAGTGGTGARAARTRASEADLIRDRKNNPGREVDYGATGARVPEPEKPVVRDPVLARALDLLKVIAVLPAPKPA